MRNAGDGGKGPPRFEPCPGSVLVLEARSVLTIGGDGEIALPGEVRWGFALNEGDLLVCERCGSGLKLTSYCGMVQRIVDACGDPWPVLVREVLSRPLEAVERDGTVLLPEAYRTERGLGPGDRVELDARIDGFHRELVIRPRVELSTDAD